MPGDEQDSTKQEKYKLPPASDILTSPCRVNKSGAIVPGQKAAVEREEIGGGFEILGRPITLEDVVRAVPAFLHLKTMGEQVRFVYENENTNDVVYWECGKPHEEQPPHVLTFLNQVLPV